MEVVLVHNPRLTKSGCSSYDFLRWLNAALCAALVLLMLVA